MTFSTILNKILQFKLYNGNNYSMESRLIHTQNLSQQEKKGMYWLLCNHFEGVNLDIFEADLAKKNWVILFYDDKTQILKGFSTLLIYDTNFEGENISVVYSGDTIIDPSAWSSSTLSRTWITSVNKLRQEYFCNKLYWLLISSGYRTYRFLPVFWQQFYPRYDQPTPNYILRLMNFLGTSNFGQYYTEHLGLVRFPYPQILRNGLNGIPIERLQDPHISFFEKLNPGHLQGDELLCLTEICEENLTSAGRRMWFAQTAKAEDELSFASL